MDDCRTCDKPAVICEVCGLCEDCHDHVMVVPLRTLTGLRPREETGG